LKTLQHDVCVTVAISTGDKTCTSEVTVLLLKNLWTETRGSWEQVKIEADFLSGAKYSINYRRVTPKYHQKMSETFCLKVHEILRRRTNLFFVENFRFRKICLHKSGYHIFPWKFFYCSIKKLRGRDFFSLWVLTSAWHWLYLQALNYYAEGNN